MVLNEKGVLEKSFKYFSTPSDLAKKMLYYVTRCGHYYCDKNYSFSWKTEHGQLLSRKTYLLFYIISGSICLDFGGKTHSMGPGQAALIDCRLPHEYWSDTELEFLWVHLDGTDAALFYEEILAAHGRVFSAGENPDVQTQIAMLIAACSNSGLSRTEIVRSQMVYRLLCTLLIPHPNDVSPQSDESVSRAMQYMEANLFGELTVEDVAGHINVSKSHFSRVFKKCTGCSPHEYIVLKRINHAKHLLGGTPMTVREVAFASGYNSEANFIASFTSKVGCTPGRFRNE